MYLNIKSENEIIPKLFRHEFYNYKRACIVTISGWKKRKTGTGKSYLALRIGELVDNNFDISKVVYFVSDFLKVIDHIEENKKIGQIVVVDEAEAVIPADRWQSFTNRAIAYTLATFRYLRCGAIFVQPRFKDIDVRVRSLLDYDFRPFKMLVGSGTTVVYTKLYEILSTFEGDVYFKIPTFYNVATNKIVKPKFLKVNKPSDDLIEEYEKLHIEFKRKLREVLAEEIEDLKGYLKRKEISPEQFDQIIDKISNSDELLESITKNRRVDKWLLQDCLINVFDVDRTIIDNKLISKLKSIIEKRVLGK